MLKGILSLEGAEDAIVAVDENAPEVVIDDTLVNLTEADAKVEADAIQVEQSTQAIDTLEAINTQLVEAQNSDEGMSEPAAKVAALAVEHLWASLGYNGQKRFPAMESSLTADDRKAAMALAIEQNTAFIRVARQQLNVAQEGIVANIIDRVKYAFTSDKKIIQRLSKVDSATDGAEPVEGMLENPTFAKTLNPDNKTKVDGNDVIKMFKDLDNQLNNQKLISGMDKIAQILHKVASSGNRSWFIANEKAVDELRGYFDDIAKLVAELNEDLPKQTKSEVKADFVPLEQGQRKSLVTLLRKSFNAPKFEKSFQDMIDAWWNMTDKYISNSNVRLAGYFASDMRTIESINTIATKTGEALSSILSRRTRMGHDAVNYIEKSFQKKKAAEKA